MGGNLYLGGTKVCPVIVRERIEYENLGSSGVITASVVDESKIDQGMQFTFGDVFLAINLSGTTALAGFTVYDEEDAEYLCTPFLCNFDSEQGIAYVNIVFRTSNDEPVTLYIEFEDSSLIGADLVNYTDLIVSEYSL